MSREYRRSVEVLSNVGIPTEVVFADDFEDLLKWSKYITLGNDLLEKNVIKAYQGNASMFFRTRTTGAASNDEIGVQTAVGLSRTNKLDISFVVQPAVAGDGFFLLRIRFNTAYADLGATYTFAIRFDNETGNLDLETATDTFVSVGTMSLLSDTAWARIRLSIDIVNKKVETFTIGREVVNIDAAAFQSGLIEFEESTVQFRLKQKEAAANGLYVDSFLALPTSV